MSRRKTSTTVYLTPEQADKLRTLSKATKVPAAEMIRQAIDEWLAGNEHRIADILDGFATVRG